LALWSWWCHRVPPAPPEQISITGTAETMRQLLPFCNILSMNACLNEEHVRLPKTFLFLKPKLGSILVKPAAENNQTSRTGIHTSREKQGNLPLFLLQTQLLRVMVIFDPHS